MMDPNLKNAKILIVDDQRANIDVLEGLLEMQGYIHLKVTTDPREVVALYSSFQPDLILLDLMMPHLSGFEVMEQLKPQLPPNTHLPILILTADATIETKKQALLAGANDFLTKPFDLVEVSLRIKNLLYLNYLQQQLLNQNQILEEKIKERTIELGNKNIELIAAKEKAEASDNLKSSFINNISHEIRTPINGILGFGEIVMDPNLDLEQKEYYYGLMQESCTRLISTITNIMDISLLNSGNMKVRPTQIDPEEIIHEIGQNFTVLCKEKNLLIEYHFPDYSVDDMVFTDADLLGKIIYQLLDNAVKFTNVGTISIGYKKNEEYLNFYVKDTGIGISKKHEEQIFSIFMQEDNSMNRNFEGTGIGLAIVKGFVELLGGKLCLSSEKDKGSTFHFTVPLNNKYD